MTVPYYPESSGTQKLVDEFFSIMACVHGGYVAVDEMDSGNHDVRMMGVFEMIRGSIKRQLVVTTHNTTLLQNSDPRSSFILDVDGEGCRSIYSIRLVARTQKFNNNAKRYLEGDFRGIPVTGYVDLWSIADRMFRKRGEADGL